MKTIQLTCDMNYRIAYLMLILKKLKECKTTSSNQLTFTEDDKKVIEYHLKDVARESVLTDTSLEECTAIFVSRINRLVLAEKREWERIRELIQKNKGSLSDEEILEFDYLSRYFYRINRAYIAR